MRKEHDFIGELEVPDEVYYGVQTMRAIDNFHITGQTIDPDFVQSIARVKKAAAMANMATGRLDKKIGEALIEAADEIIDGKLLDQFPVDPIQGGAGTSINMNMNEVLCNRALEIIGQPKGRYDIISPNNHANMAQSTNDSFPTSIKVCLSHKAKKLTAALDRLATELEKKSEEYKDVLKMGRTHLQDAVPITLGQEMGMYASAVRRGIRRINHAVEEIHVMNMGGTAVGTGLNAEPAYIKKVAETLSEVTGETYVTADNMIDATNNTDGFSDVSSAMKTTALVLIKMANDFRLMASGPRCGLNELKLPKRQPGSSIMPGKVNPVIPEVVSQVAFHIVGHDTTITMAAEAGQLELNAFEPVVFCNLFESITTLEKAVDTLSVNCITGITANRKHCKDLMESSAGIATALCPHIGYKASATIAKTAVKAGKSVRELVLEQGIMTEKELEEVLDPYLMTEVGEERKEDEARRKAC